jgi:glycerate kinase
VSGDGPGDGQVVIAPDSFKGALSAEDAAVALAEGWRQVAPDDDLRTVPMADGGEGTAHAVTAATGGSWTEVETVGPLGDPVRAGYGTFGGRRGTVAVIDVASASGLDLVGPDGGDVWRASSRGTGDLIRHALDRGVSEIVLGLGGSATNDGGAGLLSALGVRLLDEHGAPVPPGPAGLHRLARIDLDGLHPRVRDVRVRVACDVTSPLTGPHGASAVFGPQKGARPEDVPRLDAALARLARTAAAAGLAAAPEAPGSGAAGGLGFAATTVLGGELVPGVDLVAAAVGLDGHCRGARLVLTGEGRLDGQTAAGKVPLGVARVAARHGAPTVALVGAVGDGHERVLGELRAVLTIGAGPRALPDALAATAQDLRRTAHQVAALVTPRPGR